MLASSTVSLLVALVFTIYHQYNQLRLIGHLDLWNAIDGSYCTFEAFGETGNCERPECKDPTYPNQHEGGYKGELNCGLYKPTNVISISYSGAESELPASYQQRQCAEIMKLGLQGSTIMIASGDDGVAGFSTYANPTGCMGPNHDVFNPQFLGMF
jgi:tripeptidyl-peptidase-1